MSTPSPLKLTTLPGFCLHVEVKIAPENIEKFLAHFKICVEACRAEPELISFEVFQFQDEPGKFRWVENWSKEWEWFKEHQLTKPYYVPYEAATKPLWVTPRTWAVFDRVAL